MRHVIFSQALTCRALFAAASVAVRPFHATAALRGLEQVEKDLPTSTTRKPGIHLGPRQRGVNAREAKFWKFSKRWELIMKDEWDDVEQFRNLPKPKKQFGNEAAEIVWPYAVLLENVIRVHPFTKSIYCYYGQKQMTEQGRAATDIAKRFARECMIPITFHNSQCYVETEMLLEYNEVPWIVVNCVDGEQRLVPVSLSKLEAVGEVDLKVALLRLVLQEAESLGKAAKNPALLYNTLNERPNQNHYVRIDYQWMGKTPEERMKHTVQWFDDPQQVEPKIRGREFVTANWLNNDTGLPYAAGFHRNYQRYLSTSARGRVSGIAAFQRGGHRAHPMSNRAGVAPTMF